MEHQVGAWLRMAGLGMAWRGVARQGKDIPYKLEERMEKHEQDVRADDFREGSPWREVVEACGPQFLVMLSKRYAGCRLYIPDYDTVTKKARQRDYKKKFLMEQP